MKRTTAKILPQLPASTKLVIFSILSVICAKVLGFVIFDRWRDAVSAIFVGVVIYLSLQLITIMRYGNVPED